MPNAFSWQTGGLASRGTVLDSGINGLQTGSRSNPGNEINNVSNLDVYAMAVMSLTFSATPFSGAYMALYSLVAADGTNYQDGSSTVDPGIENVVAYVSIRAAAGPLLVATPMFLLRPGKTKFILLNQANVSLTGSGNTVTLYTANDQIN